VKGWEVTRLGEICDFEGGSQPPKSQFIFEQRDGYIRFLQIRDFKSDKNVTFIKHSKKNRYCAESDIMIGRYGASVGQILTGKAGAYNVALMKTIPDLNRIDRRFFFHYLNSAEFQTRLAKVADRSAQNGFSKEDIAPFPVPVPPLPEQRRIVAVLDEAFEGLAIAIANTEKNLKNARELFEGYLDSVFTTKSDGWSFKSIGEIAEIKGGKRVPKGYALLNEPTEFPYLRVTDFNDSGSIDMDDLRYVDADVRKQIKNYVITEKDVYISIAGTIGKAGIVPFELRGANLTENACRLVLQPNINNRFVYYFTLTKSFVEQAGLNTRTAAQPKLALSRLATIQLGIPSFENQNLLAKKFDQLQDEISSLENLYLKKLAAIAELKQSLLQKAFAGELTKDFRPSVAASSAASKVSNLSTADLHAGILAMAYDRHHKRNKHKTFGHVKAQKFLHLVESVERIDLGRAPIKDVAGPNDFQHMLRAEEWAKQNQFFEFVPRSTGNGYDFKKLARFDEQFKQVTIALEPFRTEVNKVIDLIIDMNSEEAELFATVHAAWNNLIINKAPITDETIVREARENWHKDKLKIPAERFHNALNSIRTRNLEPDGTAKYVGGQAKLI
jgi:restriction endonuclease S subunit